MVLINMLSHHCYYVYPSQAATLNLACCPDIKNHSPDGKKLQFRFGKTTVSVLKTVTALIIFKNKMLQASLKPTRNIICNSNMKSVAIYRMVTLLMTLHHCEQSQSPWTARFNWPTVETVDHDTLTVPQCLPQSLIHQLQVHNVRQIYVKFSEDDVFITQAS